MLPICRLHHLGDARTIRPAQERQHAIMLCDPSRRHAAVRLGNGWRRCVLLSGFRFCGLRRSRGLRSFGFVAWLASIVGILGSMVAGATIGARTTQSPAIREACRTVIGVRLTVADDPTNASFPAEVQAGYRCQRAITEVWVKRRFFNLDAIISIAATGRKLNS